MTKTTVRQEPIRRYGFNIWKDGKFVREQMVEANDPALAEARVYSHLTDGEYPWYVVPRLIEQEEAVVIDLPAADTHENINGEGEQAA